MGVKGLMKLQAETLRSEKKCTWENRCRRYGAFRIIYKDENRFLCPVHANRLAHQLTKQHVHYVVDTMI